ncbi:hypothetical protein DFH28DRAFT_1125449 [Melampsora americana]|nr:hypothetical protein DFH28DRAFT_1125456 [Melampsora americana]KAH9816654.1 hypothetical protein DFH28DRAFT_1125449 [Melampsora americana]
MPSKTTPTLDSTFNSGISQLNQLSTTSPQEETTASLSQQATEDVNDSSSIARVSLGDLVIGGSLPQTAPPITSDDDSLSSMCGWPRSMRRPDLMYGFIYSFEPTSVEAVSRIFDVAVDLGGEEHLATYEMGSSVYTPSNARYAYEWDEQEMTVQSELVTGQFVARYKDRWLRSPGDARFETIQCIQSYRWVDMTIQLYQEDLIACWRKLSPVKQDSGRGRKLRDLSAKSKSLKVQPVYAFQRLLVQPKVESAWLILESQKNIVDMQCYIHDYKFDSTEGRFDPWSDLIYALIHYVYDKSNGITLIAQLHCEQGGKISNVFCYTRKDKSDFGSEVQKNAYFHFETKHKCNDICGWLDLCAL